MNIFLWVLQVLLGLHTAMGAVWKFSNSAEQTIHRRPGGILFDGKYPVKLSSIKPQFALSKLEKRFGEPFEAYVPRELEDKDK